MLVVSLLMNQFLQREIWQYTVWTHTKFPFDSEILFLRISLKYTGKSMKMIWKNIYVCGAGEDS